MFGIPTIPKFLVLVVVIVVVYMWSRRNAVQSRGGQAPNQRNGQPGGARTAGNAPSGKSVNAKQKSIEDLVKCPSCGTYIAAGSTCGCGNNRR
ncbi:MAG TPA: hypothetical protein VM639_13690 [Dongiaceae bacterium]|nr:hypothetical protein [Dongiaceae bacterium]